MIPLFPPSSHLATVETTRDGRVSYCGASIVSSYWILTAAHCVLETQIITSIRIYTGIDDFAHSIARTVEKVARHPLYIYGSKERKFDICLLKTAKRIIFSRKVKAVPLPVAGEDALFSNVTVGSIIGRDAKFKQIRRQAKQVNLTLTLGQECENTFEIKFFPSIMLCTVSESSSNTICDGHSGSGLLARRSDTSWVLIGVTNYADVQCVDGHAVHARVSAFIDWINSHIERD